MDFYAKITKFNRMYGKETPDKPMVCFPEELKNFHSMLTEELAEAEPMIADDKNVVNMTDLADWLGDIIIYCHTFARSKGLPMARILSAIMDSNFTKLGEDGKPIYDDRGKVMKGPNFIAPEAMIERILVDEIVNNGIGVLPGTRI